MWPTFWITEPARSVQTAGFGLPVAAAAVSAMRAAPIPTSAGAKRQALPEGLAIKERYRALDSIGEGGVTLSRAAFSRFSKMGPNGSCSAVGISFQLVSGRQRCGGAKWEGFGRGIFP